MSKPRRTPEQQAWHDMRRRCYWMLDEQFHNYGGRGITVCPEWLHSCETFLRDMGARPAGYTLDRRNNNGNYEPNNCHWIPQEDQHANKRTNITLTHQGRTQTISKWADELGINRVTLQLRVKRGWSTEDCLTLPAINTGRRGRSTQPTDVELDRADGETEARNG